MPKDTRTTPEKIKLYIKYIKEGFTKGEAKVRAGYNKTTKTVDIEKTQTYREEVARLAELDKIEKHNDGIQDDTGKEAEEILAQLKTAQSAKANLMVAMHNQGITNETIARRLYDLLMARKERYYNGQKVVESEVDPNAVRNALDMIFKILGSYAPVKVDTRVEHDLSKIEELPEKELDDILRGMLK